MLCIHSLQEASEVFKALSADARIQIMELIYENNNLSMNDLANMVGVTNSAITLHISKLESAGLVTVKTTSGKRGISKIIQPVHDRIIIDMFENSKSNPLPCYEDSIGVGQYTTCDIHPTCGICTPKEIIGELDDPRVFSYPDRFNAGILWFGYGSITYNLPNRLHAGQKIREIQISFEISSECPSYNNDYPSDIYFYINGTLLGSWVSPGDFGDRKGMIAPAWWPAPLNQYGLLKTLVINHKGTFIDGTHQIGKTTLKDLNIDYNSTIDLTFSVPKDTANCGGMTLFGEDFGDYSQDIQMKLFYVNQRTVAGEELPVKEEQDA
ncbi:MAG: winged helix-turn-helix transcriptional regulator [Clostridiales bacterium]|nr:winged helix-turn-helix transcriptional regulator [Clostridiales bacterium]